jgi:hypothetical protein
VIFLDFLGFLIFLGFFWIFGIVLDFCDFFWIFGIFLDFLIISQSIVRVETSRQNLDFGNLVEQKMCVLIK